MPKVKTIDYPVNIKCIYYMPTRRKVDLSNLLNATLDLLVHYGILLDDNRNIVYSVDGSRVYYDKDNSRTEIEITRIKGDVELWAKK
jgi:Holliday junction resolvase RusA-like endonuclease